MHSPLEISGIVNLQVRYCCAPECLEWLSFDSTTLDKVPANFPYNTGTKRRILKPTISDFH